MRAVLALLQGEKAADVSSEYGIARSDLYKLRRRALSAMREALKDQRRGPKQSQNKIGIEQEQKVVMLCKRYPTLSSYKMVDRLGGNAPNPRTIQRIRQRRGLPRVPIRAPTVTPARRLPKRIVQRARQMIKQKPHLGPERIAWDLMNGENMRIGPSSIKRLKGSISAVYPMQPDVLKAIRSYLRIRTDESPYLFVSNRNMPIGRFMLLKLMQTYGDQAGIAPEKQKFHSLKHSIATHLLDAGADLSFVKDWLGHANVQNTTIYARLTTATLDAQARKVFASHRVV